MSAMSSVVQKAKELAIHAHINQFRKDGKTPFITHPEAVSEAYKKYFGHNEIYEAVCWLHDVLEDTDVAFQYIDAKFGSEVALAVDALTRPKGMTKVVYYHHLSKLCDEVKQVKLCDRYCNLQDTSVLIRVDDSDKNKKFARYYLQDSLKLLDTINFVPASHQRDIIYDISELIGDIYSVAY